MKLVSKHQDGFTDKPIKGAGIGLRHRHFEEIIENHPIIPWLEVHTENFFSPGSPASLMLDKVRADYPISAHCVGLSLGSADGLDEQHLHKVKNFIERMEPSLVSDHLSWNHASDVFLPDLLPLPYTEESLGIICTNIKKVQDYLKRQILIENPSSYLSFSSSIIPEWEFIAEVAEHSGCGILLDVNNIHVNAHNHGFKPTKYLDALAPEFVKEIHLAGYSVNENEGKKIYIDDHGAPVYEAVWRLFKKAVQKFRDTPVLIEWDTNVPELSVLLKERKKAEKILEKAA